MLASDLTVTFVFDLDSITINGLDGLFSVIGRKEMFQLTTYSTRFNYGYLVLDIWLMISKRGNPLAPHELLFLFERKDLFHAPFHRQTSTNHDLC